MAKKESLPDVKTTSLAGRGRGPSVRGLRLRPAPARGDEHWVVGANGSSLGSHPSNDICLEDSAVSRFHCEFGENDRGVWVRDLGSTNGTLLDGVQVDKGYLKHGSKLGLGRQTLDVEFVGDIAATPCSDRKRLGDLRGESVLMRRVFTELERAAASDVTLLIRGETGTGKEAAADAVHRESTRADGPFVVVDCGALNPELLESELFGHEEGAFTGANAARAGAFEVAHGGTVFLDEIGELPLDMQPRLLRVLEKREVKRIGRNEYVPVDVRVIAATHRDLRTLANTGEFRADLYYRLAVATVTLPALRERLEDLPVLAEALLKRMGIEGDALDAFLTRELKGHMASSAWQGNVRELRNYLERCVVLGEVQPVAAEEVSGGGMRSFAGMGYHEARKLGIADWERHYLSEVLVEHGGKSMAAVARAVGMDRHYFYRLLHRYGLMKS